MTLSDMPSTKWQRIDVMDKCFDLCADSLALSWRQGQSNTIRVLGDRWPGNVCQILVNEKTYPEGADFSQDPERLRLSVGEVIREHFRAIDQALLWARRVDSGDQSVAREMDGLMALQAKCDFQIRPEMVEVAWFRRPMLVRSDDAPFTLISELTLRITPPTRHDLRGK